MSLRNKPNGLRVGSSFFVQGARLIARNQERAIESELAILGAKVFHEGREVGLKRILLVDDHQMARSALRLFLEHQGYACQESDSGATALAFLDTGQPVDLIITDNQMPVMTGLEFLDQLAARPQSPPVILYSGNLVDQMKEQALRAGAYAVFSKPYNFQELVAAVTRALENY